MVESAIMKFLTGDADTSLYAHLPKWRLGNAGRGLPPMVFYNDMVSTEVEFFDAAAWVITLSIILILLYKFTECYVWLLEIC